MKETETKTQKQKKPESKGKRVLKAIFNTIINILIVVVLVVSLLIAVMALTSKSSGISTIFGYTIQPIQSDSMKGGSPDGYGGSDFEKGDLMIAKATGFDANAKYELGDVITYLTKDSDNQYMLLAHRIVDVIRNEDGSYVYQPQGDNRETSPVPDQTEVKDFITASDIASVYYNAGYEGKILKGWGAPLDYIRTQQGFFFVVLLPMIIFFMYALVRVALSVAGYNKSKNAEEKKEAVDAAVAAAIAEKEEAKAESAVQPEMSAEELAQFRQFQEFQKMQKAQQEQNPPEETPENET